MRKVKENWHVPVVHVENELGNMVNFEAMTIKWLRNYLLTNEQVLVKMGFELIPRGAGSGANSNEPLPKKRVS